MQADAMSEFQEEMRNMRKALEVANTTRRLESMANKKETLAAIAAIGAKGAGAPRGASGSTLKGAE